MDTECFNVNYIKMIYFVYIVYILKEDENNKMLVQLYVKIIITRKKLNYNKYKLINNKLKWSIIL